MCHPKGVHIHIDNHNQLTGTLNYGMKIQISKAIWGQSKLNRKKKKKEVAS